MKLYKHLNIMKSLKEHVGFVLGNVNAAAAIKQIVAAEEAGIRQVWKNQADLDTLTIFAAAATKTSAVRLGTAIVQTYPRHLRLRAGVGQKEGSSKL